MTRPAPTDGAGVLRPLPARLRLPCGLALGIVAVGTAGYRWLWRDLGASWLDALYMTIITVTTVGFAEIRPLDATGRVFTMGIAVTGIAVFFYVFGVVMEHLVVIRLADPRGRRRMGRRIEHLRGHVVLAGLGRVGVQAAEELHHAGAPFVIVDPAEPAVRLAEARGWLVHQGDATEDEALEGAGIRHARGLIVTTDTDATNMYIVLSARVLNPSLVIVSRAMDEASVPKLVRAGANRAISPYAIGGHRLAHLIMSPTVVDFFETALRRGHEALVIEDLALPPDSSAVGRTLGDLDVRRASGATVLAVIREGSHVASPADDFRLAAGDQMLALGTAEQLQRLERLCLATS